jgi:hypothetical protein
MKPRKPAPEQPDLLADIARLSRFPQHKHRQPGQFQGTDNPRALRLLRALLKQPLTRESADTVTGASNGPEEVRKLREQGLEIPCYRLGVHDRDQCWVYRGLYALTTEDMRQVAQALTKKKADSAKSTHAASEANPEASHAK